MKKKKKKKKKGRGEGEEKEREKGGKWGREGMGEREAFVSFCRRNKTTPSTILWDRSVKMYGKIGV